MLAVNPVKLKVAGLLSWPLSLLLSRLLSPLLGALAPLAAATTPADPAIADLMAAAVGALASSASTAR